MRSGETTIANGSRCHLIVSNASFAGVVADIVEAGRDCSRACEPWGSAEGVAGMDHLRRIPLRGAQQHAELT